MGASTRLVLIAALAAVACHSPVGPSGIGGQSETGIVILEAGWSTPVKLPVSDEGWEDSAYITRDGGQLLFFYHPAHDILTNPREALRLQIDGRIYESRRPFTSKSLHSVSGPAIASEGGPYVSARGAFFYHRTFPGTGQPNRIVRDGVVLDLGTGGFESNPHYCDAMNELYFDNNDEDVLVFANGVSTRLPPPINLGGTRDYQPFLTDDCQTMYFTSTRGGSLGEIYRSTRAGQNWSEPTRFMYSGLGGVGEFTMTANGRELVIIHVRRLPDGLTTDIYNSRR